MAFPWKRKITNQIGSVPEICIYKPIGTDEDCFSINDLMNALAICTQKVANLSLHCPGGSVMDGIATYNLLHNSDVTIKEIGVVGIAASMAAILLQLPGAHRVMYSHTRIMMHRISGGAFGNADDLRDVITQIESFENDICKIISERCTADPKLSPEEVKAKWFDGPDHWFSPEEALAAGLIDEVRPGKITVAPENTLKGTDLFAYYSNSLNITNNSKSNTMIKLSQKAATLLNLATEVEAADLEVAIMNIVNSKDQKIQELTGKITTLENAGKDKKLADLKLKLEDTKKKFTAEQKKNFLAVAESNVDLAIEMVNQSPDILDLHKVPGQEETSNLIPEKFKNFTLSQFQADPEASKLLVNLKKNHFEVYNEIYKSSTGKDAPKA